MSERFVPVSIDSRYQIGDAGTVIGCHKRIVKPSINSKGRPKVWIGQRQMQIHRLVLLSFVGEPPTSKHEASHLNGIKTDNRLSNLAWETASENNLRKMEHGTLLCGETHPFCKLTIEKVLAIRAVRDIGPAAIARQFGIAESTVRGIRKGERWKFAIRQMEMMK